MSEKIRIINQAREQLSKSPPEIKGLRALVVGMGKSGEAATRLLLQEEVNVTIYDGDPKKELELRHKWLSKGVQLHAGPLQPMDTIDFCVVSPGVPPFGSFFTWLHQARIPVLGEMELACRFIQRPILAVTGTNGKTTVTNMVEHIMRSCGYTVDAAGNVGDPITDIALRPDRASDNPLVLEVSSYQCETFEQFHSQSSVITNLAPDHLDRYATVQEYYEVKFNIAKNQAPNEALWMGPRVEGNCPAWVTSRKRLFDIHTLGSDGIFFQDDTVVVRDGSNEERLHWPSWKSRLPQYQLNALAACGVTFSYGVPVRQSLEALESFQTLPHRLEWVGEVKGMQCYNDSKATNVHALEAALMSLPAPIRLIAGGQAKGDSLQPLQQLIQEKVKAIYLIGEAAETFAREWQPLAQVSIEDSLEDAVKHALQDGESGDHLLLSPACASWDMFKSYAERGDRFRDAVRNYLS